MYANPYPVVPGANDLALEEEALVLVEGAVDVPASIEGFRRGT
jgi:hypothetical protein